jgi:hypothetical protein
MINCELKSGLGILALRVEGALDAADFIAVTSQVDTYLAAHGTLHGILIHAKSFPGWDNFSALAAHLKFIKQHAKKIEKIAVVADGAIANILPGIANLFVNIQVRHFDFEQENSAWDWLSPPIKATME